jgi:hypothetical protein
MGKSLRNNARRLKALGLIDYDLRRALSPGQKSNITRLARKYSGIVDHPAEFVKRTVSKKTADLLKDSGYQTFKNKKTKSYRTVIPSKDTVSVRIKNDRLIREFPTHRETSLLFLRHDFLSRLEQEHERHVNLYGEEYYQTGEGKFFTVKIGDAGAWHHFRSPYVLLNYIEQWQPKDVLNPNSKHFRRTDLKNELITQMALIERNEETAKPYLKGNTRAKTKKKNRSN